MTFSLPAVTQKAAQTAFCVCVSGLILWPALVLAQASTEEITATTSAPATTQSAGTPDAADLYEVYPLEGEQNYGDFVVGPGKFDLTVAPGESQVVTILLTNRTGEERTFILSTEDMTGSQDTENPTILLGEDRGPYTLRDYLSVPANRFVVPAGARVEIPITVALPADAEPGGRYGSLLVRTTSSGSTGGNSAAAAVVSRIAVLFFLATPGELDRSGSLIDFTTVPEQTLFSSGPITFGLLYENTGTVHTNPAGEVTISNMFGQEVGYLEVLPWFSLPQSLRMREVTWNRTTLLGRYTAEARVYRGYDDVIDTQTITFWVIDWVLLGLSVLGLFACIGFFRFITSRFTISRRSS